MIQNTSVSMDFSIVLLYYYVGKSVTDLPAGDVGRQTAIQIKGVLPHNVSHNQNITVKMCIIYSDNFRMDK